VLLGANVLQLRKKQIQIPDFLFEKGIPDGFDGSRQLIFDGLW
jgi:hypothetical protein